jgi:hypothetical protein
MNKTKN